LGYHSGSFIRKNSSTSRDINDAFTIYRTGLKPGFNKIMNNRIKKKKKGGGGNFRAVKLGATNFKRNHPPPLPILPPIY
jgi:hypothetical protein